MNPLRSQAPRRLAAILPPHPGAQMTIDGIGHPVTHDDIELWLRTVPKIDPHGPRAAAYITGYNVADKIQRAKQNGTFDSLTSGAGWRD